jgi:hypothetical protein
MHACTFLVRLTNPPHPFQPQEADEDGSGELDPQEFYDKLGPFLGPNLSQTQVAQLFMRIDADCGGTIDWEVGWMGREGG